MTTVSLVDKYTATQGRVYLTGSQALVRLPLMQRRRDVIEGLNTAGFISGYRGSPLGIYDLALWQAQKQLEAQHIVFQPGVNEDLAATAVWGTQQVKLVGKSEYDGVFAMWYGKGPGVDRSGDPLKHGSYAGASEKGGVIVLCGDDHAARSSTVAHQSDHALIHFGMPVFNPAHVQDYLDLGILAFGMSRYSGAWIGFKCVTDTVESSASVSADIQRIQLQTPTDYELPAGGLNIRLGLMPMAAESRHLDLRLEAVKAFARANGIDKTIMGGAGRNRLGVVTTGKATMDVIEALRVLGIDDAQARSLGVAVYKVGMSWPIEPQGLKAFAADCDEILVIEEKRPVIEEQLSHLLYNLPADRRPRLTGKRDLSGAPLVAQTGELAPSSVKEALHRRLAAGGVETRTLAAEAEAQSNAPAAPVSNLVRTPSFCAGCPHNTSTRVPEGSIAMGGIGCHGLATWLPERKTVTLYHMGGEGVAWIGQAPFVETAHIFQNLGDGTYFHSGLLAVRACVAANVNITYKILLNGAIAMTGGQPIEGESFDSTITAPHVAAQLVAEGLKRVVVVSDDPTRHKPSDFPAGITFHHRDELDSVQKEMREIKGVTGIIYDQACATERRRLRKRGQVADPDKRLFIHQDVCEGCGDCGIQSNCVAIEPEETALGRKRRINQSVCNKDYSCVKGLCPSFVTVEGGRLRKAAGKTAETIDPATLPMPVLREFADSYSVLIAGIGGNGVVTIGAIIGMAAHLEDKSVTVLDMSGLAQRNGPVTSHVRILKGGQDTHAPRIPERAADLVLGCDLVVASNAECVSKMDQARTSVIYNRFVAPTSAFATNPNLDFSDANLAAAITRKVEPRHVDGIDATRVAVKMLGDAIGANMFLVGYAWQRGLLPLSLEALEGAIRMNGAAVPLNLSAFNYGRAAALDPARVQAWLDDSEAKSKGRASLDDIVSDRAATLTAFQDEALAARYRALVERVRKAERGVLGVDGALSEAVAKGYFKSLYFKDEYEVGRLYSDGSLERRLSETFEGDLKISFNLAPPLIARRGPDGREKKMQFGAWIKPGFGVLAKLKSLRGGAFDIFGYSTHRKTERALGAEYEALIEMLLPRIEKSDVARLAAIAAEYENVKGYGVVKEEKLEAARKRVRDALAELDAPLAVPARRAEAVG